MRTVIVDLDGVCFDPTDRLERCKDDSGNIDWERAFMDKEVIQDVPIPGAAKATLQISRRHPVIYMTGRSYYCHYATRLSLTVNGFASSFEGVIMRRLGDLRPDHEVKKEMILDRQDDNEFIAVIDDDWSGKLKAMYEALDIPHFYTFNEFFESEVWNNETPKVD
jgi:hypothetical protein